MDTQLTKIRLPVPIMKKALVLRNSVRNIFIALYISGKPSTAVEIAHAVGHSSRSYVNMRLQELVDMGYAREVEVKGKKKYFEVIP